MKKKAIALFHFIAAGVVFSVALPAQTRYLHGLVVNDKNLPVARASIIIKSTGAGTSTDDGGYFSIKTGNEKIIVLAVSSIGYTAVEITMNTEHGKDSVTIHLVPEARVLDDQIITGVFDKRKRIESSIAITTINNDQLNTITPNSATELLRLVPGIFVNSGRGEIANNIFSRGMVLDGGYYYVSMQEDGLPLIPFSAPCSRMHS